MTVAELKDIIAREPQILSACMQAMVTRRPSVGTIGRAIARSSRSVRSVPYFARIAVKLRENTFRTICNFRFFDAEKFFWGKLFAIFFSVFRDFRSILEELGIF